VEYQCAGGQREIAVQRTIQAVCSREGEKAEYDAKGEGCACAAGQGAGGRTSEDTAWSRERGQRGLLLAEN
jgi:hypothetical protein